MINVGGPSITPLSLVTRKPPKSTLFPYTTLFRSQRAELVRLLRQLLLQVLGRDLQQQLTKRSEEHTSELQSHSDVVCRLLLEKKTAVHVHRPQGRGGAVHDRRDRRRVLRRADECA